MNKPRLRHRVVGALSLSPMTINSLARCLCVKRQSAHGALVRLERQGVVHRHGWERKKGSAAHLFELAA